MPPLGPRPRITRPNRTTRIATQVLSARPVRHAVQQAVRPPTHLYTPLTAQGRHTASVRLGTTRPHGRGRLVAAQSPKHPLKPSPIITHEAVQRLLHPPKPVAPPKRPNVYGDQPVVHGPPGGPAGTPGGPKRYTGGLRVPQAIATALLRGMPGSAGNPHGVSAPSVSDPLKRALNSKGTAQTLGGAVSGGTPAVLPSGVVRTSPKWQQTAGRFLQNTARNTLDLGTNTIASTEQTASDLAHGHVGRVVHNLTDKTSLGQLLIHGNPKKASQIAFQNPVNAALELSGARAVAGRVVRGGLWTAGKAGSKRAASAASTKRAPLAAYKGGPKTGRDYSKDPLVKAAQVYAERKARKRGQDPNVARGRRISLLKTHQTKAEHQVHEMKNSDLAMQEAIRRENLANAAKEVKAHTTARKRIATVRVPKVVVRKRTKAFEAKHGTPALEKSHEHALALIVERRLTTPARVPHDLAKIETQLAAVDKSHLTHEELANHEATVAHVKALRADKAFMANPKPAFDAAQKYIAANDRRTVRQQASFPSLKTDAKYVPYAVTHMDARPALTAPDATGMRRPIKVATPQYQAHLDAQAKEATAAKNVRSLERKVQTNQRRVAKAQGAHEVQGSPVSLRRLQRKQVDLQVAQKTLVSAKDAHALTRQIRLVSKVPKGERTQVPLLLRPLSRAEQAQAIHDSNADFFQHMQHAARLKRSGATQTAIDQALARAQRAHDRYDAAFRGEGHRPLDAAAIKADMAAKGVPEPGFFSQRPGATGKGSFYAPLARKGVRITMSGAPRTGLGTAHGGYDLSTESLKAQTAHAENLATAAEGFDRLSSTYALKRPITDPSGNVTGSGFFRSGREANHAAQEYSTPDGLQFTAMNVGTLNAVKDLLDAPHMDDQALASLSQRVRDSFNVQHDHKGQFVIIPTIVKDGLERSLAQRSDFTKWVQEVTRLWKDTVLSSSTKWLAGNVADTTLRGAMAGVHPGDLAMGHRVLNDLEKVNPGAAQQLRARTGTQRNAGGNLFGAQDAMRVHRERGRIASSLPVTAVAAVWKTQRNAVYAVNGAMEREANVAALGKFARQHIDANLKDLKGFFKTGGPAYDAFIRGQELPENMRHAAHFIEDIFGRWGKNSPEAKAFLIHSPFLQWLGVATKYVFHTLPVHHPIKTGILAAMNDMTMEERKRLGFVKDPFSNSGNLMGYLQGGAPSGDKVIPLGRLTSLGIAADWPAGLTNYFVPDVQNVYRALNGQDFTGKKITNPDGTPTTDAQNIAMAFNSLAEGQVPWLSYGRRLREGGGSSRPQSTIFSPQVYKQGKGFGDALGKVFNPVRPLAAHKQGTTSSGGGSAPAFPGAGGGGGSGGTFGLTAKYGPDTLIKMGTGAATAAIAASPLFKQPIFTSEGPKHYAAAFKRNRQFATSGPYHTKLSPQQEQQFRQWVKSNGVPFDPHAKTTDYDMRGFFKATGGKGWKQGSHFPDTFKTPYDTTFSRESKYATKNNPLTWKGNDLIDNRTGRAVFSPSQQKPPITKLRVFAHPQRPGSKAHGGKVQIAQSQVPSLTATPKITVKNTKQHAKLVTDLKQAGYSQQQINAVFKGGKKLKQVGAPAGVQVASVPSGVPGAYKTYLAKYGHIADKEAHKYGLSSGAELLAKMLKLESGYNQGAVSPKGAKSAAQFMPADRQQAIQQWGVDPYKDPESAVHAMALRMGKGSGLAGYNPGSSTYIGQVLAQDVGGKTTVRVTPAMRAASAPSSGGVPSGGVSTASTPSTSRSGAPALSGKASGKTAGAGPTSQTPDYSALLQAVLQYLSQQSSGPVSTDPLKRARRSASDSARLLTALSQAPSVKIKAT